MRKTYIDNIKWITVLVVLIYHVIYMFNGVVTNGVIGPFGRFQPQDAFQYIVYPWIMFLMFVVSGMSARFELEVRDEKSFIRNRTRKYLVPSTVGLFAFWWILGYYNMTIAGAFETMGDVPKPVLYLIMSVSGTGVLWYIQMLWIFSVILIVLRKLEKDKLYSLGSKVNMPVLILMAFAVFGAAQVFNTPIVIVYRFGIYGLGFLMGYFVFSHDEVMKRLEEYWLHFMIIAIGCGAIFVITYWGKPYPDHEVLDSILCNIYAWFGTLSILAFMKKWGDFENAFSRWMCKKSLGIYIFHYLCIAVSAWYLKIYVPQMPVVLVYLMVLVSGFAGALMLNEIIMRIPVLRWCVLGIRKQMRIK